jgi:hypothetical protein
MGSRRTPRAVNLGWRPADVVAERDWREFLRPGHLSTVLRTYGITAVSVVASRTRPPAFADAAKAGGVARVKALWLGGKSFTPPVRRPRHPNSFFPLRPHVLQDQLLQLLRLLPSAACCVIRRKRTPVPAESGHPFRSIPDTLWGGADNVQCGVGLVVTSLP